MRGGVGLVGAAHDRTRPGRGDARPLTVGLARVEANRLLRAPPVLASLALSLALLAVDPGSDDYFVRFKLLAGAGCVILAVGVGVAAVMAASRSRRSGTEELFESLPASGASVSTAQVLAVGVAVIPAVLVLAALAVRMQAWDGLAAPAVPGEAGLSGPMRLTPPLAAWVQGPAVVVLAGVAGVALGAWVRSLAISVCVLLGAGYLLPLPMLWWSWGWQQWLVPLAHGLEMGTPLAGPQGPMMVVEGTDPTAMGWHVLYLLALTAVVAAVALARHRELRWAPILAAAGLAVGAGAGSLQVVTAY